MLVCILFNSEKFYDLLVFFVFVIVYFNVSRLNTIKTYIFANNSTVKHTLDFDYHKLISSALKKCMASTFHDLKRPLTQQVLL